MQGAHHRFIASVTGSRRNDQLNDGKLTRVQLSRHVGGKTGMFCVVVAGIFSFPPSPGFEGAQKYFERVYTITLFHCLWGEGPQRKFCTWLPKRCGRPCLNPYWVYIGKLFSSSSVSSLFSTCLHVQSKHALLRWASPCYCN